MALDVRKSKIRARHCWKTWQKLEGQVRKHGRQGESKQGNCKQNLQAGMTGIEALLAISLHCVEFAIFNIPKTIT